MLLSIYVFVLYEMVGYFMEGSVRTVFISYFIIVKRATLGDAVLHKNNVTVNDKITSFVVYGKRIRKSLSFSVKPIFGKYFISLLL